MEQRHNDDPVHISVLLDRFFPELKEDQPDHLQIMQLRLPFPQPPIKDSRPQEENLESTEQSTHTIDGSL